MIKYVLRQNNNESSNANGKWYAYPVVEETMDLAALAKHMEEHNTGFSEAMCVGVLTAMVKCIKEQLLAGKNVKIDNLAIFSVGIRNREGAATEDGFSVSNNISGVKLRARATGTLSNANLNLAATLKKASTVVGSTASDTTTYTLTIGSADSTQGTVDTSVNKAYAAGTAVTITATPASGYDFDKWSDGNTTATRTLTMSGNLTLTAYFKATDATPDPDDDDTI